MPWCLMAVKALLHIYADIKRIVTQKQGQGYQPANTPQQRKKNIGQNNSEWIDVYIFVVMHVKL